MALAAGTKLGPYEILSSLGAGGMGEVYRAKDARLKREVAVKVLRASTATDADALARFQREAEAVAALAHPNVLTIYDVGRDDGCAYLTTELLEGETLRTRLELSAIPWRKAVEIGVSIAEGLAAAHAKGIIHRDLKPANIFLNENGVVKILDFGLARIVSTKNATDQTVTLDTKPGTVLGTACYMSPEQVRGQVSDARSDIFSFGCVLFEMVTGERPFGGNTSADVTTAILTREPQSVGESVSGVLPELGRTIARCLEKSPRRRFQTCDDLGFALRNMLTGSVPAQSTGTPPDSSQATRNAPSIAVLPFQNVSADPENEYFSDGVAEEIINALARVEGLRVAARTSAFSFKTKTVDIAEVGRTLNVATVLEGSVRKSGDRIRITTQLIDVADGCQLWSGRFDRHLDDIFAIQDEIAASITENLKVTLGIAAGGRLVESSTKNMEAYELYLKGRKEVGRGYGMDLLSALGYFDKAVALDSEFANAHGALADTYASLGFMATLPPREAMPKARRSAERSLELDDGVADAHCALGCVHMSFDWDWPAAESRLRRSMELNPNSVQALYHYGHPFHAYVTGDYDQGIKLCRRAVELDPLAVYALHGLLANLYGAGHTTEAIPLLQEGLARDPGAFHLRRLLALCYFRELRLDEALATILIAVRESGRHPWALYEMGAMYSAKGSAAEAEAIHDELKARSRTTYVQPMVLAMLAAWRGRLDEAFGDLDRAFDERDSILMALTTWPMCEPLRGDSRYDALLARMGLPYMR